VSGAFERVPYEQWAASLRWLQGEHMVLVGPTGCGKTTVMRNLLRRRRHVILFATKTKDRSLDPYIREEGYTRIADYNQAPYHLNKFILWPPAKGTLRETAANQQAKMRAALDLIFNEGGWTVGADELHYMCSRLRLTEEVETYSHQGRSSGLTLVSGMQRPAWVPLITFSSATHALLWKTTEPADLKRLSGLARTDIREVAAEMNRLGKHDFIGIDTRDENARPVITSFPRPGTAA